MAVPKTERLVLVTGDLAFFYDSNALWNEALPANIGTVIFFKEDFLKVESFNFFPFSHIVVFMYFMLNFEELFFRS